MKIDKRRNIFMNKNSLILIACEESGTVMMAFRELGFTEVYSCDLMPTSCGHPEWHIQGDVKPVLKEKWDMIIAFPPCTHIAASGARHFEQKRKDGRQQQGIDFFMLFTRLDCPMVAIENPVGIMSSVWRKPDQIIQPYMFGDSFSKKNCLWLKGLPKLQPTKMVDKGEFIIFASGRKMPKWYAEKWGKGGERSRTFQGIANAMSSQWSNLA